MVKGKRRTAASAAKARCRVLAFTGLRPKELMRYRPEHWNRTTQSLVVYTGKGGRTWTIPLSAPAAEGLADRLNPVARASFPEPVPPEIRTLNSAPSAAAVSWTTAAGDEPLAVSSSKGNARPPKRRIVIAVAGASGGLHTAPVSRRPAARR